MAKFKFCPKCGFPLSDCFKFCPECGRELSGNEGSERRELFGKEGKLIRLDNEGFTRERENAKQAKIPRYIKQQLIYGERPIYICRIHWKIWLPSIFWFIASFFSFALSKKGDEFKYIALILALISLYFLLKALIKNYCTNLAITNKRIICKFGFIRRSAFEINLNKVEGIKLEQSFLDRILGCASVCVTGTGAAHVPVPDIMNAEKFKQALLSETERAKNIAL